MSKSTYVFATLLLIFALYGVIAAVGAVMDLWGDEEVIAAPAAPKPNWELVCPDMEWARPCIHHNKATGEIGFVSAPSDGPVE